MWATVDFGQHEGKTLPQIVLSDPDWFFWAVEERVFDDKPLLRKQAREIYRKARTIKIPGKDPAKWKIEYVIDPMVNKFSDFDVVEKNRPTHTGSSATFREDYLDLSTPRRISEYDKLGCQSIIKGLKYYVFGDSEIRLTKKRCEEFFSDDSNFA